MKMFEFGRVIWQRRFVFSGVLLLALACSPIFAKVARPTYEATSELAYVGNGSAAGAISLSNAILPASDLPDLAMSSDVIDRARKAVNIDTSVDDLRLAMSVKESPHSNVVPIVVRSKDPSEALVLANALAESTVQQYKLLAERQYDDLIGSISNQLQGVQVQIRGVDALLQRSVQAHSAVGAADALDAISKHLDDLELQRASAYATYVADSAAMSAQSGASAGTGLAKAIREQILTADPLYQSLATTQSKDAAALATVKAGYTDAFPGLAGLEEKVRIEKSAADQAAQSAVVEHPGNSSTYAQLVMNQHAAAALASGDKARVNAIDQDIATAHAALDDLPRYGVAADILRARRDSATAAYQQLEIRYQQTLADRAQAGALSTAFVLDHANAAYPRIPQIVLAMLIAFFVLALAIGGAYVAEALDPRIRTAVDVEDLYGAPRIGRV
jgi:capsular polysaccharide biosynthesis protein